MPAFKIIALADRHAGANASAKLCVEDATALYNRGRFTDAKRRALRSLEYSVGAFHPDYLAACAANGARMTELGLIGAGADRRRWTVTPDGELAMAEPPE